MNICGQDVGLRYLCLPWVPGNNLVRFHSKGFCLVISQVPNVVYTMPFFSFHFKQFGILLDLLVMEECGDDQFI